MSRRAELRASVATRGTVTVEWSRRLPPFHATPGAAPDVIRGAARAYAATLTTADPERVDLAHAAERAWWRAHPADVPPFAPRDSEHGRGSGWPDPAVRVHADAYAYIRRFGVPTGFRELAAAWIAANPGRVEHDPTER